VNRDEAYLRHILEAADRIARYSAIGRHRFFDETLYQDAVIRQLEIIGEATKNLSIDLRSRHPDLPWRRFAGLRDVLIHNYPGVNLETVWDVTQSAVPDLKRGVEAILSEFANE
jgi:uncharacterized protein with HEPN domain